MADKKISELPSITGSSVSDSNDTIPIVDASTDTTKKITRRELFKGVDGATFTGDVRVEKNTPYFSLYDTSEPAGERNSWLVASNGHIEVQARQDDGSFKKTMARFDRDPASLSSAASVITKDVGDSRYAQLSEFNTYTKAAKYTTNGLGLLQFQRGGTGRIWGIGTDVNQNSLTFYDQENARVAARIEEDGTSALQSTTIMTREKGDNRYIAERGSNSNGEYVRFPDGTQICWSPEFSSVSVTGAVGSIYRSSAQTWTYPATFSSSAVSGSVTNIGNSQTHWGVLRADSTATASITVFSYSSTTARRVKAVAFGRWK